MINIENIAYGIVQLVIAVIFSVIALYIGFSVFGKMKGMDEEKELVKRNVAVGILVASVFISIAIVVQSGIAGLSIGFKDAIAGNIFSLVAAIFQLIIGIILAIAGIYLALKVFDIMTKGIDEFKEIEKGNVAVAIVMAGVIISVALIIQSGVLGITGS